METPVQLIDDCLIALGESAESLSVLEDEDLDALYPAFTAQGILAQRAKELADAGQTPLTPEQITAELTLLNNAIATSLDLVVPKNRALLESVFGQLKDDLTAALAGSINPYDLAQIWQQRYDQFGDYQFARLARTETSFAENEMMKQDLVDNWDADSSIIDAVGQPAYHPSCLCGTGTIIGGDGKSYIVPMVSAAACWVCQDAATEAFGMVP